jgi:hypothetical protein
VNIRCHAKALSEPTLDLWAVKRPNPFGKLINLFFGFQVHEVDETLELLTRDTSFKILYPSSNIIGHSKLRIHKHTRV